MQAHMHSANLPSFNQVNKSRISICSALEWTHFGSIQIPFKDTITKDGIKNVHTKSSKMPNYIFGLKQNLKFLEKLMSKIRLEFPALMPTLSAWTSVHIGQKYRPYGLVCCMTTTNMILDLF